MTSLNGWWLGKHQEKSIKHAMALVAFRPWEKQHPSGTSTALPKLRTWVGKPIPTKEPTYEAIYTRWRYRDGGCALQPSIAQSVSVGLAPEQRTRIKEYVVKENVPRVTVKERYRVGSTVRRGCRTP